MIYKPFKIEKSIEISSLYSLFMPHVTYGYTFEGEIHDFWECVYVIDGEICASSDENVYYLNKGDIVFHKPQEFHKFHVEDANGANLLIFSFSLEGESSEKMEGKICRLDKAQYRIMKMFIEYVKRGRDAHPESKTPSYFYNMLPLFENDYVFLQMVRSYIIQLILSLSQSEIPVKPAETFETKLLKDAIEKMNGCIETSLSISELADSLNVSLSSLKRVFKKYTGISIYKYYLIMKTRAATTLLQEGMSAAEVSVRLGFSSPAYFSATYKREAGKSPSKDMPKH